MIDFRNYLYASGLIKSRDLPASTISVGNLSVGGTGKTPLVAYTAQYLANAGEKVCVISRGYGRRNGSHRVLVSDSEQLLCDAESAGDEPFELANQLLGKAVVISDKDRIGAAEFAKSEFGVTVYVLDDAFQHRKAGRDLNIVVIDAMKGFGNYRLFPAGILRESISGLARADLVVLNRFDLSDSPEKIEQIIEETVPGLPVVRSRNEVTGFTRIEEFNCSDDTHTPTLDMPVFAFCGLGNPENFFSTLKLKGISVAASHSFPDHFSYNASDLRRIEAKAREAGCEALVTTAKDAVKLHSLLPALPIYVCRINMIFENEKSITDLIDNAIRSGNSR